MTTPPVPAELTLAFPTPGPLLGSAYRDLYLAVEGSDNQKATIGDTSLLPQPWDPPTCRNPQLRAELWTWLQAVVVWFNHEYTWDPAAMIPTCWPQHPHLVHEVAVLADQRRRAGIALDSDALEEWHRYSAPGFNERLQTRLKAHCEQDHQPWPARGRHARHTDQKATNEQRRLFEADIATASVRTSQPATTRTPQHPDQRDHRPLNDKLTGPLVCQEGPRLMLAIEPQGRDLAEVNPSLSAPVMCTFAPLARMLVIDSSNLRDVVLRGGFEVEADDG